MVAEAQNNNVARVMRVLNNRRADIAAVVFLLVVALFLGGYSYRVSYEAQGNPLGTMLPEFKPAVLFAAGKGMVVPEALDVPALDAFLSSEAPTFDPKLLPEQIDGTHLFKSTQSSFAQSHWLLFYSMGWCWRIFGISHASLEYLCALFYCMTAFALYVLFRVGMRRLVAVFGVLLVLLLPPFLCMAPMLRDFSKAPFILLVIALIGHLLKEHVSGKVLIKYALLLGLVTGVGYGFRQDILICLPPAVFVLAFVPLSGHFRLFYHIAALLVLAGTFGASAFPSLAGVRADSGSVSTHTLFQGLSREAEQRMAFGDADYDLLLHPYDTEVHAMVNAHARLRGNTEPMDFYLSPAYGSVGRALFYEWARMFPADLFVRGLASIETTMHLSSLSLAYHAFAPLKESTFGRLMFPYYQAYTCYIESFGWIIVAAGLCALAFRSLYLAGSVLILLGWFMAYPNLLFEVRHAFHLAFVISWMLLFLLDRALQKRNPAGGMNNVRVYMTPIKKIAVAVVCVLMITVAVTGALRSLQRRQVESLLESYSNLPLERVETQSETHDSRTLISPSVRLPGLRESWNLRLGDVAVEYLMLEFYPHENPIPLTVRYQPGRGADFTRNIVVPAGRGNHAIERYYFPVYEMANYVPEAFSTIKFRFANTPLANLLVHHWGTNRFQGVEFFEEDMPLLKGIHRVTDLSRVPWLLYLTLREDNSDACYCRRMGLEKELVALPVMLQYQLGMNSETAAFSWLELLGRFPGYKWFAERAEAVIPEISDLEKRSEAWHILAKSAPEQSGVIAAQIAAIGDEYKENKNYVQAENEYRLAMMLSPIDRGYQVKLADSFLAQDKFIEALENYRAVLLAAPESPYSAAQHDSICEKQHCVDEAAAFWRMLHEKYPDAAVPALRLGRHLERQDQLKEALALYRQVEIQHPENAEAILRQGIVVALMEGYAKGRSMMDRALELAPELRPELVAGLTRIATHYTETGAHAFAEAIYRDVIKLAPDDGWHQVRYGEALMAQEYYDKAREVFLNILERAPESPYSAYKLDEIFEKTNAPELRLATWQTLHESHPDAFVPALHLAKAHENSGNYQAAIELYRRTFEQYPDKHEAGLRLGALTARFGSYEEGRAMMRAAVSQDASLASLDAALLTVMAEQFRDAGDMQRASGLFEELLADNPDDVFLGTRLAETLIEQGLYEKALEICRTLMGRDGENENAANMIDTIYQKQQDNAGLIAEWRSLCTVLPLSIASHVHLGTALEKTDNLKQAHAVYEEALRNAPENAKLNLHYGILTALIDGYDAGRAMMDAALAAESALAGEMAEGLARIAQREHEQGSSKRAEALYREAIALAPDEYWYRVRLGELLAGEGQNDEAIQLFFEVMTAHPESPQTARLLDQAYSAQKKFKKCLETWEKIIERHPDAVTPRFHLCLAYERCSMRDEAIKTLNELLKSHPDHQEAQALLKKLQAGEQSDKE